MLGDRGVFAASLDPTHEPRLEPGEAPRDIRFHAGGLAAEEAAMAAVGRAVISWQHRHRFCGRCGQSNRFADGGWRTQCTACATESHPRTDPVVIIAIEHDGALLLGRQASWPPGFFSCLAGFVEPAETLEAAAAREAMEEAGVTLERITYLGSQP
jgi:NAD+ diphosphatase